jgi:hypothetical protein
MKKPLRAVKSVSIARANEALLVRLKDSWKIKKEEKRTADKDAHITV